MIVAQFPVSLRFIHKLAFSWIQYLLKVRLSKGISAGQKYNFLYFSYRPDFEILCLSIETLVKVANSDELGKVFVVVDQKAPFTESQEQVLKAIYHDIVFMPIYDFCWGSAESTYAEIEVFLKASRLIDNRNDFLVKVDSDVLFFEWKKLAGLLMSSLKAVGDFHYVNYRFAQGGLYMMRVDLVLSVFENVTLNDIENVVRATGSVGEDVAISYVLNESGNEFFDTRLMLFPDEYNGLDKLTNLLKIDFVALHCHKEKDKMSMLSNKFGVM